MSDDLTTGGGGVLGQGDAYGAKFSYPSPVYNPATRQYESDGMVWLGLRPMVERDVDALEKETGTRSVDPLSVEGCLSKGWSSHHYQNATNMDVGSAIPGGEFSSLYRMEHVYPGVSFTYHPTWLTNADGEMYKEYNNGVPYHTVQLGDGYTDAIAGPAPRSLAAIHERSGGTYFYDEEAARYRMRDADGNVVEFNRNQQDYDIAADLGAPITD